MTKHNHYILVSEATFDQDMSNFLTNVGSFNGYIQNMWPTETKITYHTDFTGEIDNKKVLTWRVHVVVEHQ